MTTTSSSTGSSSESIPVTSLSRSTATTPTSRRNENDSSSAATDAAIPCGLCAASTIRSALPGRPPAGRASSPGKRLPDHLDVDRPGGAAGPEEHLDRGQRDGRVLRVVRSVQRQEQLVVRPGQPLQAQHLPADGDRAGQHPELGTLPGHGRADLDRAPDQHLRGLVLLGRQHGDRVRLDDPGLLPGDLAQRVAEVGHVVQPDRRHHDDRPSATLVESQVPPIPTSMTATSTGASAKAANPIAVRTSKNDSGNGWSLSTSSR